MDFVGAFFEDIKGHGYLYVVVDKFDKLCVLMTCKKTIRGDEIGILFFERVWVHFGILRNIIYNTNT